jgi:hypothetical protein
MKAHRDKYLKKLDELKEKPHLDEVARSKELFAILNEQKQGVTTSLNKAEELVLLDLRRSPACTIKNPECEALKKTLDKYVEIKSAYTKADLELKRRIGQALNKEKKFK